MYMHMYPFWDHPKPSKKTKNFSGLTKFRDDSASQARSQLSFGLPLVSKFNLVIYFHRKPQIAV